MRRRVTRHDGGMAPPPRSGPTPLDGVRVLDMSRVLSGPHCGRILADLGADVIKVEPPDGDLTRFSTPRRHSMSTYYSQQNAGKRNVSLDLSTAAGADVFREMVDVADVVVENYRPGVLARLGLAPSDLIERNPRLIVVSISGYGQDGPWIDRRAYAPVVEAEAGVIDIQNRRRSGRKTKDPLSHADVYTGMDAASGVLAALFQRERTGRGQWIDVAMAQSMMYANEHLHDALWEGEDDPSWIRSFRPDDYAVMTVANGESLVVSGHPAERGTFEFFTAAIGQPELGDDPRFATVESRLDHLDELQQIIADFAATVPDPETFEQIFSKHRLAVGRVRAHGELARTDWAAERDAVVRVSDRGDETVALPNAPWKFSDGPGVGLVGEPRYRGEDNRQVLAELLGYDDARVDALEADGVLSHHRPR